MGHNILSKEAILCMQYAGIKPPQIIRSEFSPEEYAEALEKHIDKAEMILAEQQEHSVVTLTFQDEDFPRSFKKIRDDCPAMIHCIGNMALLSPAARPYGSVN